MTLSLTTAQQDVRDYLAANFSQTVVEDSVPAAEELIRVNGLVAPYIIYNFADLAPSANRSLVGPRFDGYTQPVNIYAIAPDITTARALNHKVLDRFIGFQPSYSGEVRKRPGGGAFGITGSNGVSEAYIVAASFVFTVEFISGITVSNPNAPTFDPAVTVADNGDGTWSISTP